MTTPTHDSRIVSTNTLRTFIGILGLLLPLFLAVGAAIFGGCQEVQSSVSDYYHTIMRDVFVGMLCGVALFLVTYRGYDQDHIFSRIAGLGAFGVVFLPTSIDPATSCLSAIDPGFDTFHLISAAVFLAALTYFSLVLFPKTNKPTPSRQKRRRNRVFKIAGFVMLGCLILLFVYFMADLHSLDKYNPVFWLEAIALFAFGISWLAKGQLIYRDARP